MAANSVSLPATRVLTEAFRHLRYLILDELAERCSEALSPDSISWLLTVPAVWNKSTRQLIKEIAIEVSNTRISPRMHCKYSILPTLFVTSVTTGTATKCFNFI